jgi:hypothetical protein
MTTASDSPNHLLSALSSPEGDEVIILADRGGLEKLRKEIDRLLNRLDRNETDHEHFFTPDWGGDELTAVMPLAVKNDGYRTVHHIKLYSCDADGKKELAC